MMATAKATKTTATAAKTAAKTTKGTKTSAAGKTVEAHTHHEAKRVNIPTAELSQVARSEDLKPVAVAYRRRDPDLDPQLIWRGKYGQDGMEPGDLLVRAAPLYIQEKVHPKALIDDLRRESEARANNAQPPAQPNLFSDFNGIDPSVDKTEFYRHEQNWANRLVLGDSLQAMAGLAEREGLRGAVQCIYFDPPYGIKFNSNFQWSVNNRDVKDGKADHITREPEQVKAFRDTWKDGVHSYLGYIRDRLIVARELLADSGSIFVQIGDENVHRVRAVMDEVFGEDNCISQIAFAKTSGYATNFLTGICDYILWYAKVKESAKFHQIYGEKIRGGIGASKYNRIKLTDGTTRIITDNEIENVSLLPKGSRFWVDDNLTSQGNPLFPFTSFGRTFSGTYKTTLQGMERLSKADRIYTAKGSHRFIRYVDDFPVTVRNAAWMDIGGVQSRTDPKIYVVQTSSEAIQRCILMTTDPGDLVLDPTCGSGTTAYVAEQWGRRWITIDTSRVALALARARLMGARYPFYLLSDSPEGRAKEAEITQTVPSSRPTYGSIRQGFVYRRVPHITLKSIANNAEIDVIWEKWQEKLEPLRQQLNKALKASHEEWEIPREALGAWSDATKKLHASWQQSRMDRQREIDASIAAKADTEFLFDKPFEDSKKVRVAGPFTVESLSPHRMLAVGEGDEVVDPMDKAVENGALDFASMILEDLKTAGIEQANKEDRIDFDAIKPWAGRPGSNCYICAEGTYRRGEATGKTTLRRAAIFIGPEFGSVGRADLSAAAREAADDQFDELIVCAFNYDAASADYASAGSAYGRIPILKARMNADLHMSTDLKNTGKGNLFVIFGEPDIAIEEAGKNQYRVKIRGVDIFDPKEGRVRSDETDNIACWFIDTDYNEESFFVRHAYFLGANDPYAALQRSLKAEIDKDAWESLYGDTSRPFDRPKSGRIAVKVINHLGDEVMKVYRIN
jgi:adenine-specific DNA-methyltransferase